MKLILSLLIALNIGLYELPRVTYKSGVEGAKQTALDVEEYLFKVREAVEDAYLRGSISTEVMEDYDFLDKSAMHYHHLFVMSVLFYEEAPVEVPYGKLVTKFSMDMVKRLVLIKKLITEEGIDISVPPSGELVVSAHSLGGAFRVAHDYYIDINIAPCRL